MKAKQLKLGVISDTHFNSLAQGTQLIGQLCRHEFADVDAVIHAGDMIHPDISMLFAPVPVYAVRGNNDPAVNGVPISRVLELGQQRIGIIHGWGMLDDLEQRMIEYFAADELTCLVYGHSHLPVCHTVGDLLVVNPGSASDRRMAPWHSVALLHIDGAEENRVSAEIINIEGWQKRSNLI
jgi:hypothetical protein